MTALAPHLEQLAERYRDAGLRPLIDPVMDMLVMDCPQCHAQDGDELGLYRPVRVVPRLKTRTILCTACGRIDVQRLR